MLFRRVDPALNMYRWYSLSVQPTLFDSCAVICAWGRMRTSECVNDLRQLVLEFSVEMLCVGEIFLLLSFRKVVEKWTEERCPLFHNHYYCDGDRTSSCLGAGFGGLIQTAVGNCGGLGSPLTNRCGFFW